MKDLKNYSRFDRGLNNSNDKERLNMRKEIKTIAKKKVGTKKRGGAASKTKDEKTGIENRND